MSEKLLYNHKGKLVEMAEDQVLATIRSVEAQSRSGKFTYSDIQMYVEQVAAIKEKWPDRSKQFLKEEARKIANGGAVTYAIIRQALYLTYKQLLAPERAKLNNLNANYEFKWLVSELELSGIFRIQPIPNSNSIRAYQADGKTYRLKISSAPRRLVVDASELNADYFVYAYFNEIAERSWLIGYATKQDLAAVPATSRDTHPETCTWRRPAHALELSQLRPMADILAKAPSTEFANSAIMEQPPQFGDIPIRCSDNIQNMVPDTKGFDLLADLGLKTPTPPEQEHRTSQAAQEEVTLDI